MDISVAFAAYNGAKNFGQQLDSLAAQTLLPAELVVGDDGSTDDTLAILDAFAKIAPFPVRVHRNPSRLGYRANFFAAARRCHGPLISFCDQDGSGKRFKPNLWQRWRYRLEYRPDMYRVLSTGSPRNTALFRWFAAQPEISSGLRARAAQAAIAGDELGPLYRDRAIACSGPFAARLAAFTRLARRGG